MKVKVVRQLGSKTPMLVPNRILELDDEVAREYLAMSPPVVIPWPPAAVASQPPAQEPKKRGRPKSKPASGQPEDAESAGDA